MQWNDFLQASHVKNIAQTCTHLSSSPSSSSSSSLCLTSSTYSLWGRWLLFRLITLNDTRGRSLLDEWSARRRDLYLKTHDTHNRQTPMPMVEFEPSISASERPQAHALDGAATWIGHLSSRVKHTYPFVYRGLSLAWNAYECKVLQSALFSSQYRH
jgi:hypothetical protein